MTEREKMLAGKIYDPFAPELQNQRQKAHVLCQKYNQTNETQVEERTKIIRNLLGELPQGVYFQGPIYMDYGINLHVGKNFYANFNFTCLDICPVIIGDNVFCGPNVTIVTPMHPFLYQERNPYVNEKGITTDQEYGRPITIKSNCWIASNVVICGGVTIGEGCVIGAGSVVTRDIPDHSLACGNPCRVIRPLTEKDSIHLKKELW